MWQEAAQSTEGPLVALLCRGSVVIATRKLERLFHVPETLRVKSGVWDEQGTLIYATSAHIKYLIPPLSTIAAKDERSGAGRGDNGIVRTLDRPIYIVAANTAKCTLSLHSRSILLIYLYMLHFISNALFDSPAVRSTWISH